jgi:phage portal protein BeeE
MAFLKRVVGRRAGARPRASGIFGGGDKRDPQGLMSGVYPAGRGDPPDISTRNLLETYETMPWVRAIAGRIATKVAETQWTLSAQIGSAGKAVRNRQLQRSGHHVRRKGLLELQARKELRVVDDHVMLDALAGSNPLMTGFDVMKLSQLGLELVGDSFLLKERNGLGVPIGLWPIPAHWVLSPPTPAAPRFTVSYNAWQGDIPDSEILWLHDPAPANPYARGSGTARALGDELETDEYASKHAKQLFFNRARPDFLVMVEDVQKPELKRLEHDWLNRLQGFWRVAKPYFLNRKVEIHEFGQSQTLENLTLVPLRQFERDVIQQAWGFPPEILGILENGNRATIEAADYFLEEHVIQPRREFLRAALQARLIPEYDDRLIVDYVSTVREDKEFELNVMKAAAWAFTADEWRSRAGLPPLPDGKGESHLVPLNSYMTEDPLDQEARPAPHPAASAGGAGGGEDGPPSPAAAPPPKPKGLLAAAPQELHVHLEGMTVNTPGSEVHVHPEVKAPDVHVHPELKAGDTHFHAGSVEVHPAEMRAPDVHVHTAAAAPPVVEVYPEVKAPEVHVHPEVHGPDITVVAEAPSTPVTLEVTLPEQKRTVRTIERGPDGKALRMVDEPEK